MEFTEALFGEIRFSNIRAVVPSNRCFASAVSLEGQPHNPSPIRHSTIASGNDADDVVVAAWLDAGDINCLGRQSGHKDGVDAAGGRQGGPRERPITAHWTLAGPFCGTNKR